MVKPKPKSKKQYKLDKKREEHRRQCIKIEERPKYWPIYEEWPLENGLSILTVLESLPPIYILNNGTRVKGTLYHRRGINKKQI